MEEHELWLSGNAVVFIQYFIVIVTMAALAISATIHVKKIKNNWANSRCSPIIMPFAGLFGYNTKENFEFCMGKIFSTHSMPYLGSFGTMFSNFTGLLQNMFDSISSLRNVIASLGGGINVVFQEFTERISTFFFKLRLSAIHIKSLIGRMYAILFSVMYMGLSGITGMSSFTNTTLYSFLDTFCFPGDIELDIKGKGKTKIKDVRINDIILPTDSKITATFRFYSKGQPMVKLGSVIVSTNHYVYYLGHPIKAGDHPEAVHIGSWDSDEPLYCLNTSNNYIHIDNFTFLDYDETSDGDKHTMKYIEEKLNATVCQKDYLFEEYGPAFSEITPIRTIDGCKLAKDIQIGDKLVTGSEVIGLIRKQVREITTLENGTVLTPSTLYWNTFENKWKRIGDIYPFKKQDSELISFIVVPNSQIELGDGLRVRDYMELCSPDSEMYYSKCLETCN